MEEASFAKILWWNKYWNSFREWDEREVVSTCKLCAAPSTIKCMNLMVAQNVDELTKYSFLQAQSKMAHANSRLFATLLIIALLTSETICTPIVHRDFEEPGVGDCLARSRTSAKGVIICYLFLRKIWSTYFLASSSHNELRLEESCKCPTSWSHFLSKSFEWRVEFW